MKCPKCSKENPEKAQTCSACSYDLTAPEAPARKPKRKISKTAIASGLLAGLAAGLMFLVNPTLAFLVALASVFSAAASIRQIRRSKGRLIGKTFAIAVAIFATMHIILLSYLRIDAPPIPDDYTIKDIRSAAPDYNKSYLLLNTLGDEDPNSRDAPAIGLSADDIDKLGEITAAFKKTDYDSICRALDANAVEILKIWERAQKGRDIITQLDAFPEIADLSEPRIESEIQFLKNMRSLVHIYRAYIALQIHQGNQEIAISELVRLDSLFGKISLNARSIIAKLVCFACLNLDIDNANFIANHPLADQDSLEVLAHNFPPLPAEYTSLRNPIIFEYLMFRNELIKMLDQLGLRYSSFSPLKLNSSCRLHRNYCNRWLALEENLPQIENLRVWPRLYPNLPVTTDPNCNLPWYYTAYNPIGSMLLKVLIPAMDRVSQIRTNVHVKSDLLQIVLNKRLGKDADLKARAYSDEYTIDSDKKIIFSPGLDGKPYTRDDIKLILNPDVLNSKD